MILKRICLRTALLFATLIIFITAAASCQFCPHSWGEEFVYKEATCAEDGILRKTCGLCGANNDAPINGGAETVSHTWGEEFVYEEATCAKEGIIRKTCSVCGVNEDSAIPSPQHGGYTVIKPTCTEGGYTLIDCPECGYEDLLFPTEPRGHKPESNSVFCSKCRETVVGDNVFISYLSYLERDEIILSFENYYLNEYIKVIDGEITLSELDNSEIIGSGTLTIEDANGPMAYDASITDGVCYLYSSDSGGKIYHRIPFSLSVSDTVLPGLEMDSESTADIDKLQDVIDEIGEDRLNIWIGKLIDLTCNAGYYNYAYTFYPSADKMKAYNARLSAAPLATVIDEDFGDGSFALLAELILPLLDDGSIDTEQAVTEAQTKTLYELMGVTAAELEDTVATVDAVIDALTGAVHVSFTGNSDGELLEISLWISDTGTVEIGFSDKGTPPIGELPDIVESLRDVPLEENKDIDHFTDGFLEDYREHFELTADSDGMLEAVNVTLVTSERVDWKSDWETVDGTETMVTYYEIEETTYRFVIIPKNCETVSIKDLCCGWYFYGFEDVISVQYTVESYVQTVVGATETNGERTLVESYSINALSSVTFLINRDTGSVMHVSRIEEVHGFELMEIITAESCLDSSYDVYACKDCGLEEKRNERQGDNHVPGNSGWCEVCFRTMWCPDAAVYTYESESKDVRCELYENGNALVHDKYYFYTASWYEQDGAIYVHLTERNDPYIIFTVSDGILIPLAE